MGRSEAKKASQMSEQQFQESKEERQQALNKINQGADLFRSTLMNLYNDDPAKDAVYQGNLRTVAGTISSGAQNAAEGQLQDYALRTGTNTGDVMKTIEEGRREKERALNDVLTRAAIDDHNQYQARKMSIAAMLGQIPGMYAPVYGTSSGSQASATGQMTQLGQTPGFFDSLLQGMVGGAARVGAAFAGN